MKLQADPTVIYGMGPQFDGNLKKSRPRGRHAYNTYVHTGLPPTPIALRARRRSTRRCTRIRRATCTSSRAATVPQPFSTTLEEPQSRGEQIPARRALTRAA
jgi:UPF0755 protein